MMVNGETITKLRQDLDTATTELAALKLVVSELKEKTKILETLDGEKFQSFIESLEKGS
jgi:cell division protein FtsL